jgi:hypothetical protein
VLEFLGLTVATLMERDKDGEARTALEHDVVYVTASKLCFTYLEDNTAALTPEGYVSLPLFRYFPWVWPCVRGCLCRLLCICVCDVCMGCVYMSAGVCARACTRARPQLSPLLNDNARIWPLSFSPVVFA